MGAGVPDQSHEGIHGADPSGETLLSSISREEAPRSSSVPVIDDTGDAGLVARAAHGDQRAWEEIVDRYLPLVNAIARSYGLPAADREDAVQTVWLTLNQHLPRLHSPQYLRHWLRRVTRDACARQRRSRLRHHPVDPHLLAETALLHHGPETEYLRKERHEELHRAIDRLTDPLDRRAAQYYLGREIPPTEEPPCPRTAANRRRRLLRRLRRLLEEP